MERSLSAQALGPVGRPRTDAALQDSYESDNEADDEGERGGEETRDDAAVVRGEADGWGGEDNSTISCGRRGVSGCEDAGEEDGVDRADRTHGGR